MRRRGHVTGISGWKRALATSVAVTFGLTTAFEWPDRPAFAQPAPATAPAPAPTPQPPAATADRLTQPELEQLLAPIALYPDQLLTLMLMAATYPLELVQAQRWLGRADNAKLKGEALVKALESQPWDDSVKSLVPFPDVLKMMSDQLEWTQRVGDALLAQQQDVLTRSRSCVAGRSRRASCRAARSRPSTSRRTRRSRQPRPPRRLGRAGADRHGGAGAPAASPASSTYTVPPPQQIITIEPTQPDQVYVPAYNPSVVYGSWPYPSYPPTYYPPPAASYPVASALLTGMAFAGGVALVGSAWGWANPSWGNGDINVNRVNNINRSGTWQHNVEHRQGVAYRGDNVRNQYQPNRGSRTAAREEFRGRTQQAERGGGSAFGSERGGNLADGERVAGIARVVIARVIARVVIARIARVVIARIARVAAGWWGRVRLAVGRVLATAPAPVRRSGPPRRAGLAAGGAGRRAPAANREAASGRPNVGGSAGNRQHAAAEEAKVFRASARVPRRGRPANVGKRAGNPAPRRRLGAAQEPGRRRWRRRRA